MHPFDSLGEFSRFSNESADLSALEIQAHSFTTPLHDLVNTPFADPERSSEGG
jgi:hypothetical protein